MHGRVKVRTTAEQEALKKIERDKKLALFKVAIELIFRKRADQLWDDELLEVTERMVLQNPDITTLWNVRREAYERNNWTEDEREARLAKELTLTENCLRENPKSYSIWHHRCWVINSLREPDWNTELGLCTKCLNLDERNFHCWDYRQYIVKKAGISDSEEFNFSTMKILHNFSNYSSWHYRSKILSRMFPDDTGELPIRADKHKEELDLVMNATFTDPNDSSAWFYQRWLLDCSETKPNELWRARITSKTATIIFNKDVRLVDETVALLIDDTAMDTILWESTNGREYSKIWTATLDAQTIDLETINAMTIQFNDNVYDLSRTLTGNSWYYTAKCSITEGHNKEQLMEQIQNYQQLSKMEPNNKWSLLTDIYLMKNYDLKQYHSKIIDNFSALAKIDVLRSNYYHDMRSKCMMEHALHNFWLMESDDKSYCASINLSGLDLTVLYNEHQLCLFDEINLSDNKLSDSLHRLIALQECRKLFLDNNGLRSLKRMPTLRNLEEISLRNNNLSCCDEILMFIKRHEKLVKLDLRENPFCHSDDNARILDSCSTLELLIN